MYVCGAVVQGSAAYASYAVVQVKEGSASKEALAVRLANVDAVLSKRERRTGDGAELKDAANAVRAALRDRDRRHLDDTKQ